MYDTDLVIDGGRTTDADAAAAACDASSLSSSVGITHTAERMAVATVLRGGVQRLTRRSESITSSSSASLMSQLSCSSNTATVNSRPVTGGLEKTSGLFTAHERDRSVNSPIAIHMLRTCWRHGVVVSGVRRMNEVNTRRAGLVLGWVTVSGRVYHLGM